MVQSKARYTLHRMNPQWHRTFPFNKPGWSIASKIRPMHDKNPASQIWSSLCDIDCSGSIWTPKTLKIHSFRLCCVQNLWDIPDIDSAQCLQLFWVNITHIWNLYYPQVFIAAQVLPLQLRAPSSQGLHAQNLILPHIARHQWLSRPLMQASMAPSLSF